MVSGEEATGERLALSRPSTEVGEPDDTPVGGAKIGASIGRDEVAAEGRDEVAVKAVGKDERASEGLDDEDTDGKAEIRLGDLVGEDGTDP